MLGVEGVRRARPTPEQLAGAKVQRKCVPCRVLSLSVAPPPPQNARLAAVLADPTSLFVSRRVGLLQQAVAEGVGIYVRAAWLQESRSGSRR